MPFWPGLRVCCVCADVHIRVIYASCFTNFGIMYGFSGGSGRCQEEERAFSSFFVVERERQRDPVVVERFIQII